MIDEKKIEEAAQDCRFETISQCHGGFQYVPQCFSEEIDKETELIESAFKQGAKWAIEEFLKSLWHPMGEEPKYTGRDILIDMELEGKPYPILRKFVKCKEITPCLDTVRWVNKWEEVKKERGTVKKKRWLYIDDLLPKQKGDEQ